MPLLVALFFLLYVPIAFVGFVQAAVVSVIWVMLGKTLLWFFGFLFLVSSIVTVFGS